MIKKAGMIMKRIIQWFATAFLVFLAGIFLYNLVLVNEKERSTDNYQGLQVGMEAPDFHLSTIDGETIKLSDFQGKKVFLNFWATWCTPCKEEMPAMEEFYQFHQEEVVILAVNAFDTEIDGEKKVHEFVTELELTFPILLDTGGDVLKDYKITHMPTTYFIGEDGIIKESPHRGPMDEAFMTRMTEKLNEAVSY